MFSSKYTTIDVDVVYCETKKNQSIRSTVQNVFHNDNRKSAQFFTLRINATLHQFMYTNGNMYETVINSILMILRKRLPQSHNTKLISPNNQK